MMSTRSGKRIHGSLHENNLRTEVEVAPKSERKTRSKQLKENIEDASILLQKFKKRENYVSYPTDDEQPCDGGVMEAEGKHTRTLRKNALKELNPTISTDISDNEVPLKNARSTRRTRKFAENATDGSENVEVQDKRESVEKTTKKSKRKKVSTESTEPLKPAKKKNKKKKGKGSNSFVTENIVAGDNTDVVNKSNMSIDSFHSAAGSPCHGNIAGKISHTENITQINLDENNQKKKSSKKAKKNGPKFKSSEDNFISEDNEVLENKNGTFEIEQPKRRSSIRLSCRDETDTLTKNRISLIDSDITQNKNDTFDIEERKSGNKKPSIANVGIDEPDSVQKTKKCGSNVSLSNMDISQNENETFDIEKMSVNRTSITGIAGTSSVNISSEDVNLNVTQNKNNTFDLDKKNDYTPIIVNTTYEKDTSVGSASKSRKRKSTMDILDVKTDISSLIDDQRTNKTSSLNSTYDKDTSVKVNTTFELKDSPNKTKNKSLEEIESPRRKIRKSGSMIIPNRRSIDIQSGITQCLNITFEATKDNMEGLNGILNKSEKINTTFDKDQNLNTTFDKLSRSSLISSDSNNDISRISITSDESIIEPQQTQKPTIMNITPVLINSSIDDSLISEESKTEQPTPLKREGTFSLSSDETKSETVPTPLKREGTFTKDGPDDPSINKESPPVTPRKNGSLPSPGCTPFPNKSGTKEKPFLNVTRSIEKKRSMEPAPRITRVMFCSPVNNPVVVAQQKRTVIKSNLKGSNKSFVYEESVGTPPPVRPSRRKRSHTHSEADEAHHKRKRLTDDLRQSVDRLSRPRTSSANAKLIDSTPSKKSTTPSKAKVPRTKLPNFAALHQKQFDKMESLDECQERRARRARQLLTTPGGTTDRSPKVNAESPARPKEVVKKADNLTKSFSQEASKQKYTRFGFKLNLDVNPFSIPGKNPVKPKEQPNGLKRQMTLPSLTGATSLRREVAKQVVMREKSFSDKRLLKRNENRTIIKGVRTNRRFELQMQLRNIE